MIEMLQKIAAVLMSLLMSFLASIGLARTNYTTYENYAYGTSEQQVMDIYVPSSASSRESNAAVIFLHNGFFESGTKADLKNDCQTIANRGYIAVAMDYSLLKENDKSITVYTMLNDIRAAITKLAEFSSENKLNIKKIALVGDSAGGYLALNYAYSRPFQSAIDIAFVAARVAPSDFSYAQWKDFISDADYIAMYNKLTGASAKESDLTVNAATIERNTQLISPVNYVNRTTVPTLFGYAQNDAVVPFSNKESLEKALTDAGVPHDYVDYGTAGHDLSSVWNSLLQTADYSDILIRYCSTYFG